MMDNSKIFRNTLLIQGVYYGITGIWPVISIESFMMITGPKTDLWLVKILGAILFCEGVAFFIAGIRREYSQSVLLLAWMNCVVLAFADIYYYLQGVISPVYLADAAVEAGLLVGWAIFLLRYRYRS